MGTQVQRLRTVLTVAMMAVVALAWSATAAFAQYPPADDFGYGVVCTPESPAPGETVTCEVVGALPGEQLAVTVTIAGTLVHSETSTADAEGEAAFVFAVDREGEIIVRVVGAESGETTVVLSAAEEAPEAREDAGEAVAAPAAPRLPITGGQILLLTGLGVALLGAGLLALRRRDGGKVSVTA
jgi:hypothetical protein